MKRYLSIFIAGALLLSLLTACAREEPDPGDVFVRETDRPLPAFSGIDNQYMAIGENGYYFQLNHFLFFADRETMNIVPLCNRPNCRHHEETNDYEVWKCNAYVGEGYPFLQFYQEKLYTMSYFNADAAGNKIESRLVELSPDGSNRKRLIQIPQYAYPFIHRGYLYYIEQLGGKAQQLKRRSLSQLDKEPEVVFTGSDGAFSVSSPAAYGNRIYIEQLRADEETHDLYTELYQYNIQTREISRIHVEDEELLSSVSLKTVSQEGDLVLSVFHPSTIQYDEETGNMLELGDQGDIYLSNPDGTNVRYQFNCQRGSMVASVEMDADYFYLFQCNSSEPWAKDLEFQRQKKLIIMDFDQNPVAEVSMANVDYLFEETVSDDRYVFIENITYLQEERRLECYYLDKQTIGTGNESFQLLYSFLFDELRPPISFQN